MKLFNLNGTLTKRTEFAAVFDDLITDTLRTDCLTKLPDLPNPKEGEMLRILNTIIDDTS